MHDFVRMIEIPRLLDIEIAKEIFFFECEKKIVDWIFDSKKGSLDFRFSLSFKFEFSFKSNGLV